MTTRRELTEAVAERYRRSDRSNKRDMLHEFVQASGRAATRSVQRGVRCMRPAVLCCSDFIFMTFALVHYRRTLDR